MNPILAAMGQTLATLAAIYIPRAYRLGKDKARRKYGPAVAPWGDADNANLEILLSRHGNELARALAIIEHNASTGTVALGIGLAALANRSGSWAWVLSPAMAMGISAAVNGARMEISREEGLPPDEIGIIWYTAKDTRVCKKCEYLAGRWFDAHEAYELAAQIHPNCRCPASFDIGTPDEALVGPIPGYRPGTIQDIYRDLGGHVSKRLRKARDMAVKPPPVSSMARDQIQNARNRKPPQGPLPIPIKTWNEADHPRDSDGKFTDGSGGGGNSMGGKPTQPQHIGGGGTQPAKPKTSGKPKSIDVRGKGPDVFSREANNLYADAHKYPSEDRDIKYADVDESAATRIKQDTGYDVRGFMRRVTTESIRHMLNDHSKQAVEDRWNQIAITDSDVKLIPEIINNPDSVIRTKTDSGENAILYEKEIDDTRYSYIEVVGKRKKRLTSKTMWRKKPGF